MTFGYIAALALIFMLYAPRGSRPAPGHSDAQGTPEASRPLRTMAGAWSSRGRTSSSPRLSSHHRTGGHMSLRSAQPSGHGWRNHDGSLAVTVPSNRTIKASPGRTSAPVFVIMTYGVL